MLLSYNIDFWGAIILFLLFFTIFCLFVYLRRLPMQSVVIRAFQNYLLICFVFLGVSLCVWVLHRVTPGIINGKLKCPLNVDAKIVVVWTLSHFCTLRATSIFFVCLFCLVYEIYTRTLEKMHNTRSLSFSSSCFSIQRSFVPLFLFVFKSMLYCS